MIDTTKLHVLAAAADIHTRMRSIMLPSNPTRSGTAASRLGEAHATADWSRLTALANVAANAERFSVANHHFQAVQHSPKRILPLVATHANGQPPRSTSAAPPTLKSPVFPKWAPRQERDAGKAPKRGFTVEELGRGWRACSRCRNNKCLGAFRSHIRTCLDCEKQKRTKQAVDSASTWTGFHSGEQCGLGYF